MTAVANPETTPDEVDTRDVAQRWLDQFAAAAMSQSAAEVLGVLTDDVWWRDIHALTWDIGSSHGLDAVERDLHDALVSREFAPVALDFSLPPESTDGMVQLVFHFTTDSGLGRGVARLREVDGEWKAWTVSTRLEGLRDFPEGRVQMSDVAGDAFNTATRPGKRKTWRQLLDEKAAFEDREPTVVVIGGGHAGVMTAARLEAIGVPTLIVDSYERAGDNWRTRYENLSLHDVKWAHQFPYMPYPANWPLFTPKEKMADWIETYVHSLELNLWTRSKVTSATYDSDAGRWEVDVDRDGTTRTLRPQHVVFATGLHGTPVMPTVSGMDIFEGKAIHSTRHAGGAASEGKHIVIVGAGASGCDVAQDAYENGATVTIVQRSPIYVLSQRHGVPAFNGQYYSENMLPDVEDADLLASSMAYGHLKGLLPDVTRSIAAADADLIAGLEKVGFRTTLGPDDVGMLFLGLVKGGGFYIDKGAAQLIVEGEIKVQPGEIREFTKTGVVYSDGTVEAADEVIFCTGFKNMRESARPILGDAVTDQLGLVWGLDDGMESRTTFRYSGHEKLWFIAGGLKEVRIYSKGVACVIKAMEEGLLDPKICVERRNSDPV